MGQWIFYLDESGAFESAPEPGLAGGVLLDVSEKEVDVAELKRALVACAPCFPWPLHATDLRLPMAHVAGALCLAPAPETLPDAIREACRLVEQASDGPLQRVRDFTARGQLPPREVLEQAQQALTARAPALGARLVEYRTETARRTRALFGALSRVLAGRLFAVGAAVGPDVSWDRALVFALHRALQLIRVRSGPQDALRLTVAARRKPDGTSVSREDVHSCAAEAARLATLPGEPPVPDVEVTADFPREMRSDTSPWLVVADFVCNRLYQPVRTARTWDAFQRHEDTTLGLPLLAPVRWLEHSLPTFAFERGPDGWEPGWARDQALRWRTAARSASWG